MEIARLGCDGAAAREGVHLEPEEQGKISGDDGRRREAGARVIREAFYERSPERASAVGFLAMADGMNAEGVVGFFGKADAVVTDAKAQLAGLSLELLDVAFASLGEAMERGEDAHGRVAVETADIGAGAFGPGDFLHA